MRSFQEEGNLDAFRLLFERHKDGFVTFLAGLAGSREAAEDLSQQVWLKLIDVARRGDYRETARFRTYLYTLGRNLYIDEFRRKHASTRTDPLGDRPLEDADANADPGRRAARDERRSILAQAMADLPLEQREVIALWAAGTSTEAMASITGAPPDTVLSRKKYALDKLRKALSAAGIERGEL